MSDPKIVVVHSRKGGVGKSTLAYELAWLLDAPLVDLDWEGGTVSKRWGYRWQDHARSAVADAVERGRAPRLLSGRPSNRPDLVPGHADFKLEQPEADHMSDALVKWAGEWDRDFVVVDTHPGADPATNGSLAVAHAVVVPVPMKVMELYGTEATIDELAGYPLILAPNLVPRTTSPKMLAMLKSIVGRPGVTAQVGPLIPDGGRPVYERTRRMAMTAQDPMPKNVAPVSAALERLAQYVKEYADA
jgi:chromosome partitioning protein